MLTLSTQLRWCSEALADVDSWDTFFPVINITRQTLTPMMPQPYIGTCVPLAPAKLWGLIEALNHLEKSRMSIADFLCNHLDPIVSQLDILMYREVSMKAYDKAVSLFLLALSAQEACRYDPECMQEAQARVNSTMEKVWQAFSFLPLDEQKKRLPPPPTSGEK